MSMKKTLMAAALAVIAAFAAFAPSANAALASFLHDDNRHAVSLHGQRHAGDCHVGVHRSSSSTS